jgi:putative dehydrogenase
MSHQPLTGRRVRQADIGMIGLGIMGSAMAGHLMRAGHRVIGYDVLARRRQDHRRAGGEAAASCRDVGTRASRDVNDASRRRSPAFARRFGGPSSPSRKR